MIFLDESGHTGTQKYSDGKWNTNNQPYFVLVGFIVDEIYCDIVTEEVNNIMKRYRLQKELKFAHKTTKKNIDLIMHDISLLLEKVNGRIYAEVVNKKFCIVKQIVDYCVAPYYDISPMADKRKKTIFANIIYEKISNELLGKFVDMFDSNRQDVNELLSMCDELKRDINNMCITKSVEETQDTINNYQERGLRVSNLFPLVDKYKGNISTVAISPHVDCFNDIVNRFTDEKVIVHDEISDMEIAFEDNIKFFTKYHKRKINLQFDKSVENKCLQVADVFAGCLREYVEALLYRNEEYSIPDYVKKIINESTLFVSTYEEQVRLFPDNYELVATKDYYEEMMKSIK